MRNQRGFALAWSALILLVMIGIVGLAIDWGKVTWNVHQLQNAADAAALAGAAHVGSDPNNPSDPNSAWSQAAYYASQNEADRLPVTLRQNNVQDAAFGEGDPPYDETPYDIVIGRYFMQFHGTPEAWKPSLSGANAVKVIARRDAYNGPLLGLVFGPIFGTGEVAASRSATALVAGANGAGLICLARTGTSGIPGIDVTSNTNLIVKNGDIQVNSVLEPCVTVGNNSVIECTGMSVHGTFPEATSYDQFPVSEHMPMLRDPLRGVSDLYKYMPIQAGRAWKWDAATSQYVDAGLPTDPKHPGYIDDIIKTATITGYGDIDPKDPTNFPKMLRLTPGYFPNGFKLDSAGAELFLEPGVYAIGGSASGSGLVVNGGKFFGEGVMLYLTCDWSGKNWADLKLNGSGGTIIEITEYHYNEMPTGEPSYYKDYSGMAIFQDRRRIFKNDNSDQPVINGGATTEFKGTIYLHNGEPSASTDPWSYGTTVPYISGGGKDIGIQLITDRIQVGGGGNVTIDYDGRNKWVTLIPVLVEGDSGAGS
jgi:hypothetical protein